MHWLYLALAIGCEVVATSLLKSTAGFSQWRPGLVVAIGYALAFFFLSLTLRQVPVAVAYAIWSGVGIVLVTLAGWYWQGQALDAAACLGIALIVVGVLVLKLCTRMPL